MGEQPGLGVLELPQELRHGLRGPQPGAHGHGVDEQADHALDAVDLRRPSGDGDARDHVVPAREPGEHDRPDALEDGAHGEALLPRPLGEGVRGALRQPDIDLPGNHGHRAGVGRDQGGSVQVAQRLAPGVLGGDPVLPAQPGEVVAVRAHRGQSRHVPRAGVQGEQLPPQDGQRPAVEQHVVERQDEPVAVRAERDQREPHQGRFREVQAAGAVLGDGPVGRGGPVLLGEGGEVDVVPGHLDRAVDDLERAVDPLVAEARPQVGVAAQQAVRRRPEGVAPQRALQVHHELHRVQVGCGLVVDAVEEDAFLQR
ncbi:hypothetical protein RKD37_008419 [Streptomyces ambofaciens]